jgi:hypothetical protein
MFILCGAPHQVAPHDRREDVREVERQEPEDAVGERKRP